MLEAGLCGSAVVTDVSEKCLQKATTLLKNYIEEGRVAAVCCNGLQGVSEDIGQVLIAGMGGEEIAAILRSSFIPKSFVLQPMRNVRAVREVLLRQNAHISVDEPFESSGKFYYVIKGEKHGKRSIYGGEQLEFGLNPSNKTTKKYILSELAKKREYLKRELSDAARAGINKEISFMEKALLL